MKAAKLVSVWNYWTVFSAQEIVNRQKKNVFDYSESYQSWDEDLFYEIASSELWFKNIVLSQRQREILWILVKERNELEHIKKFNLPITSKLLLYWAPWTWKTLSAYCLAWELWKKLYVVNLANLISSRLWETSKNLDRIFSKARNEDAILFIDEFDAISRTRDSVNEHWEIKRTVNVLLQLFDIISDKLLVICATNRIKDMDDAILRRFDYKLEYPNPDKSQISLYLDFLQFSFNFKFKNISVKNKMINSLNKNSYANIKNKMIGLLKQKIFFGKVTSNKIILTKDDIIE